MKPVSFHITIGKKLFFSYLLIVLLPVSLISGMLMHQAASHAREKTMENAHTVASHLVRNYTDAFQIGGTIIDSLLLDDSLKEWAYLDPPINYEVIRKYNDYDKITLFKQANPDIVDIKIFISNSSMLENGEIMILDKQIRQTDWFHRAQDVPGSLRLEYMPMPRSFSNTDSNFLLISYLNDQHAGAEFLVTLAVKPYNSQTALNEIEYPVMLLNPDHSVILTNTSQELVGTTVSEWTKNDSEYIEFKNERYFKVLMPIDIKKCADTPLLLMLVPMREVTTFVKQSLFPGISLIMICLILSLILMIFFTHTLSKRIYKLRDYTYQVTQGNLDIKCSLSGQDEISDLAEDLNTMIDCINRLMKDNEAYLIRQNTLKIQHKDAQLSILKSQINPHFLFNTLDSIRMHLIDQETNEAAQAIQLLANMLRTSLETGNHPIPLSEELLITENYLHLMKFRFGNRLNYQIIHDGIDLSIPVLPFIIQPLVENAVVHGLDNCTNGGFIKISVQYDHETPKDLFIIISDNGCGIDPRVLRKIQYSLYEDPYAEDNTHIGIPNVHKRLQLYYGEHYGLTIHSIPEKGTQITAKIMGD